MKRETKIQVGLRLLFASWIVFFTGGSIAGAMLAGIVMTAPSLSQIRSGNWRNYSGKLFVGPESKEQEEALLQKVRDEARKEVTASVKAWNEEGEKKINEIVEKRVSAFKDLPIEKLKTVVQEMEDINKAIADLKGKVAQKKGTKAKKSMLSKALEENFELIKKSIASGGSHKFSLFDESKIAASSFGDRVIFGFREVGVDFAALPDLFILDLIQVMSGGPGSNPLSWIERSLAANGGAGALLVETQAPTSVAEQGNKLNMGWTWAEAKISAETIAAMVPITKQAIQNYPMLEQEVRFELLRYLGLELQRQIIKGTGVSPELKGISTYAQAFAAGAFAGQITAPNEYDALVVAATQILNENYVPTVALVSHTAKARMNLAKSTTGHYVMPPFSTANGLTVYGLNVKNTNVMDAEEFYVMDPTKSLFNWVENINIEVGMINDDFKKNIYRLRAELTGMHRIKNFEAKAFVKGDFTVAKNALGV